MVDLAQEHHTSNNDLHTLRTSALLIVSFIDKLPIHHIECCSVYSLQTYRRRALTNWSEVSVAVVLGNRTVVRIHCICSIYRPTGGGVGGGEELGSSLD